MNRKTIWPVAVIVMLLLLCGVIALIPEISERIAFHYDRWQVRIRYALNPPEEAVFIPQEQVATVVQATLWATMQAQTQAAENSEISATQTPTGQATIGLSAAPTRTPTSLPGEVFLEGVRYQDQHGLWNYCGPANVAMALSYWGWEGDRLVAGEYLKPNDKDKNVMPYEMESFVDEKTNLSAVLRNGGTPDLLKSLIAAGYPVLIEKGVFIRETTTGKESWMGHYNILTGYDDASQQFIIQDSFYTPDYRISYSQLYEEWRSFNYLFLVVYPPEKLEELSAVLGDYADRSTSDHLAYQHASEEIASQIGVSQFFAWYNRGSSLVWLQDYSGAAEAYDSAFRIYASLPAETRPWRIMWYQTGPYFAYYYMGRYTDVIELADTTVENIHEPYLEESFYWRGRAKLGLGDETGGIADLKTSVEMHPGFIPGIELLQSMGVNP